MQASADQVGKWQGPQGSTQQGTEIILSNEGSPTPTPTHPPLPPSFKVPPPWEFPGGPVVKTPRFQ